MEGTQIEGAMFRVKAKSELRNRSEEELVAVFPRPSGFLSDRNHLQRRLINNCLNFNFLKRAFKQEIREIDCPLQ